MTELFFLDNSEQIKKQKLSKKTIFITTDYSEEKSNVKFIQSYSKGLKYNREFYNPYWIQEWAQKKLFDGKSIKEIISIDNQTVWPFFEYLIYANIYGLKGYSSSIVLHTIDLVEKAIEKHRPSKVTIIDLTSLTYQIVKDVCEKKKIKVNVLSSKSVKNSTNKLLFSTYVKLRVLTQAFLGKFMTKLPRSDILMISGHRFCTGKPEDNKFWGPVVEKMKKSKIIEYDGFWNFYSLRIMLKRHLFKNSGTQYIGTYYDFQAIRETFSISKEIKKKWKVVKNSSEINKLEYKGINVGKYLKNRFDFVFSVFPFYVASILALTAAVAKKEQPKVVMMEHEYNYYGLGFLLNSKKINFSTVALEFEAVNTRTSVHRHVKSKEVLNKKSNIWRPIADMKCASSDYTRKILEKYCNVPHNKIVVTGQPRLKNFRPDEKKFNKKKILRELGVDGKKKIIVYGTKYRQYEDSVFNKVTEFAEKNKDVHVFFKIAPSTNLMKIKKKIRESENVKIIQSYDVNKLLFVCDLCITDRSAMGMEAIAMGKPLLVFDFYGTCQFPYYELGAGFLVPELKKLTSGIKLCLNDKKVKDSLKKGRNRFVKEYLNNLDGKASDRVIQAVNSLLQ